MNRKRFADILSARRATPELRLNEFLSGKVPHASSLPVNASVPEWRVLPGLVHVPKRGTAIAGTECVCCTFHSSLPRLAVKRLAAVFAYKWNSWHILRMIGAFWVVGFGQFLSPFRTALVKRVHPLGVGNTQTSSGAESALSISNLALSQKNRRAACFTLSFDPWFSFHAANILHLADQVNSYFMGGGTTVEQAKARVTL